MGATVIPINQRRVFSLEEAAAIFPIIRKITKQAHDKVKILNMQMSLISQKSRRVEIDRKIQTVLEAWQEKVSKLGCDAKGMWLVDFDNGDGFYCWHYPEATISHSHGYSEGFKGRSKIH